MRTQPFTTMLKPDLSVLKAHPDRRWTGYAILAGVTECAADNRIVS